MTPVDTDASVSLARPAPKSEKVTRYWKASPSVWVPPAPSVWTAANEAMSGVIAELIVEPATDGGGDSCDADCGRISDTHRYRCRQ